MIRIDAPITPVTFKRVIPCRGRPRNPAEYTEFKDELGYFALKAMEGREPLKGRIQLHAEFFKKRRGITKSNWGDVDNFLKAVLDSLNGICYKDDGQVVQVSAVKKIGEPRILIELEEVNVD